MQPAWQGSVKRSRVPGVVSVKWLAMASAAGQAQLGHGTARVAVDQANHAAMQGGDLAHEAETQTAAAAAIS